MQQPTQKKSIHQSVLDELERRSGSWPEIAQKTGIPYHTLTKIAYRQIKDPGVSKIEALHNYFQLEGEAA